MDSLWKCAICQGIFSSSQSLGNHGRYCSPLSSESEICTSEQYSKKRKAAYGPQAYTIHDDYNQDDSGIDEYSDCEDSSIPMYMWQHQRLEEASPTGNTEFPICHPDYDAEDKPLSTYKKLQEVFYDKSYGVDALGAMNLESFIEAVSTSSNHNMSDILLLKLYAFGRKCKLSRSTGDALLELIRLFKPCEELPKSWKTVVSNFKKRTQHYRYVEKSIGWPSSWEMESWKISGQKPDEIIVRARDPLEMLSYLAVDPTIQFSWKEHVHYDTFSMTDINTGENYVGDLMSSSWAKNTERVIRQEKNPEGKLMPCLLYHDGVAMGHGANIKSVPVLGTCGNFSDELIRKNIAKFCLGFIPDITSTISVEALISHLMERGMSRTAAGKEVRWFNLHLEKEFWSMVTAPLKAASSRGAEMYVLGKGLITVYTFHPFSIGDDPAIHRQFGLYEGNSRFACVTCEYPLRAGVFYNPDLHPRRDGNAIAEQCRNVNSGQLSDKEEKYVRKLLDNRCIMPFVNAFHHAFMGYNNHCFNNPQDLFHLFCAGIAKSLVLWILSVVDSISTTVDRTFRNIKGVLDARLKLMPQVPDMPHVNWTVFKKGLMHIMSNKSKKEKGHSTGSGGGYRSSEFITALLQLLFAIGTDGQVLPTDTNYSYCSKNSRHLRLGNVTKKVLQAIKAVLNVYFECKKSCFTDGDILNVDRMCHDMVAKVLLVWDLKQTLLGNQPSSPLMRKLHSVMHLSLNISMFGALSKSDAGTWESSNRYFTTENWRRTSRRYTSSNVEMLTLAICQDHCRVLEFIAACHTHDTEYINSLKPEIPPEVVLVYPMRNVKHVRLCVDANHSLFICEEEGIELEEFIGHKELSSNSLTDFCKQALGDKNWNCLQRGDISLKLIQALTYNANKESGIGKGSHHAMKGAESRKPRFDFICIQMESGDIQVAQIVSMLQLSAANNTKYLYIVQYMEKCTTTILDPFSKYKWEVLRYNRRRQPQFFQDIINFESIIDTAFIIPDSSCDVVVGKPQISDRFWFIPRKFFDRCGWDDLDFINCHHIEGMQQYIRQNSSGAIVLERNVHGHDSHNANNESGSSDHSSECDSNPSTVYSTGDSSDNDT